MLVLCNLFLKTEAGGSAPDDASIGCTTFTQIASR